MPTIIVSGVDNTSCPSGEKAELCCAKISLSYFSRRPFRATCTGAWNDARHATAVMVKTRAHGPLS